jgi:hypothetical protein
MKTNSSFILKKTHVKLMVLTLLVLISCGINTKKNKDDGKPSETSINFLKWYKLNYEKLNPLTLGKYIRIDSTSIYSIDTNKTNHYIELLKKCGYVSDSYIENQDIYFKQAILKYKTERDVEIADEFEYDFVLCTQEVNDALDSIDNPKILSEEILNNTSKVKIAVGSHLLFNLCKIDNNWYINKIENLGFNE